MAGPVPIAFMVRELGPGGTERQATEIARSVDRSRFSPHMICFREGVRAAELRAAGVPVLALPVRSFKRPVRGAIQFLSYLRANRIRLVHTFDVPMNTFGVPLARLARIPVVLSSQRAFRDLNSTRDRRILRCIDRMAHGIVANCDAVRTHLIEDEGVPADRIHVCPNGVDLAAFNPRARLRLPGLERASLVIGSVSLLRPEKNLATLIEAFARLAPRYRDLTLVIGGGGPELAALKSTADRLGVADACRFEPPTAEVARWYASMDMFVLPSRSEALSNSLMEAMACGCAVVASRVGGNPELVREDETGLLFPAGDSAALANQLERLILDPGLRFRLGSAASARMAAEFSLAASTKKMEQIYSAMLAAAPSGIID